MPNNLFFLLLFTVLTMLPIRLSAQDMLSPWQYSIGVNAVDVFPAGTNGALFGQQGELFEDFFNFNEHWSIGIPSISLSRRIWKGLSLGVGGSLNTINKISGKPDAAFTYFSVEGFLKLAPLSNKRFSPYAKIGWGYTSFESNDSNNNQQPSNSSAFGSGNVGFEFRLGKNFTIGPESGYYLTYELEDLIHFQHKLLLSYRFGAADSDQDGVPDKRDICPDEQGLKKFQGCPDNDNDNIPDDIDKCPGEPGSAEQSGCPDRDNDGIIDKEDKCPNEKGAVRANGCPDRDNDNVPDKLDKCPDEKGEVIYEGCTYQSKLNQEKTDDTPKTITADVKADVKEETTKPETTPETKEKEQSTDKNLLIFNVFFVANSADIIGKKNIETIKNVKQYMDRNPKIFITLEGYASSEGAPDFNETLSLKRAISVRSYLLKLGTDPKRIQVKGMGTVRPKASNDTLRGRSLNRRVEFRVDN